MKNIWYSLWGALFLAVCCVEPIVMDPMEEMPVVVNCVLTGDREMQYLDLYYAKRPSASAVDTIKDASVVVTSRDSIHTFSWNGKRWQCRFLLGDNMEYRLSVKTADGKVLSAETTTPRQFRLEIVNNLTPEEIAEVQKWWRDPEKNKDFKDWRYSSGYFFTKLELEGDGHNIARETPYDGEVRVWITGGQRLSTDHPGADPISLVPGKWSDLKFDPIYDDYLPPVAEYCENLPLYGRFIRIHQKSGFAGKMTDEMLGAEPGFANGRIPTSACFVLSTDAIEGIREYDDWGLLINTDSFQACFVSQEYDEYLRFMVQKNLIKEGEFAELYSMDPICSNVKGGLGIFGAMYTVQAPLAIPKIVKLS